MRTIFSREFEKLSPEDKEEIRQMIRAKKAGKNG